MGAKSVAKWRLPPAHRGLEASVSLRGFVFVFEWVEQRGQDFSRRFRPSGARRSVEDRLADESGNHGHGRDGRHHDDVARRVFLRH